MGRPVVKIGIMSDSHGHIARTRSAIRQMIGAGVGAVVHCGDIGSEQVLLELTSEIDGSGIPVYAVLGNVDLYNDAIADFPPETDVHVRGRLCKIEIDGHSIAIVHGDDALAFRKAVGSGDHEFVFTGHTHTRDETRTDTTRIVNPGALHNAYQPSAALLDLESGVLTFFDIAP